MNYDDYGRRVAVAFIEYQKAKNDLNGYMNYQTAPFLHGTVLKLSEVHNKAYDRLFRTLETLEVILDPV
jgi:hypothetical protein